MQIQEIFEYDVTRNIPPVVYFHEQSPEKLADEVREYIITGGWKPDHPNYERVKRGIHEHYVNLLTRIAELVDRKGGPELPASWISGFYGSGKSSFAKLLGLSLDGARLPDGSLLSEAWLARDQSQRAAELRGAWTALTGKIDPISVVFDIGGVSRGDEHIHSAIVRQVQTRLGYCTTSPHVAAYELKLERDGHYDEFLAIADRTLGKPWPEYRGLQLAEDHFSVVLHEQFPKLYPDPQDWIARIDGQALAALSAEDAARDIGDMLERRARGKTLFIVVDEVSQYIFQNDNRMLALQSLVSALGQRLKGKAWLLATGQQKLDDQNDSNVLNKMKDRFPPELRVHLDPTSIRDVVHRRLLQKRKAAVPALRELYGRHRANLSLFAYGCENITEDDFVEVYPLLPQHIDLILRITSALRTRSSRAQGDHHAIRGLLQMLGELFRTQRGALTEAELGALITIDQIYEIQGSALDSDTQNSMARLFDYCAKHDDKLAIRCAKAVALLELVQADEDGEPTDSKLVARCLYAHVAEGDNEPAVRAALERLLDANLLSHSDKAGYRIQSAAGEEWERERADISVPTEDLGELIMDALRIQLGDTDKPVLQGLKFAWRALFSTDNSHHEVKFVGAREATVVVVDLRVLPLDRQGADDWINRSSESSLADRLLWIAGSHQALMDEARRICKSKRIVARYQAKRSSLNDARSRLLNDEENRLSKRLDDFTKIVGEAFMTGRLYFRGNETDPRDYGATFKVALNRAGTARLPSIYSHFVPTTVSNGELEQLLPKELSGPSTKFLTDLGILAANDAGRLEAACAGPVPQRIMDQVSRAQGLSGQTLLDKFSDPPFGYDSNLVKACVAGLLRGRKVKLVHKGSTITSIGDLGVVDLFRRDREFKATEIYPAEDDGTRPRDLARIAELLKVVFATDVDPEPELLADAVGGAMQPKVVMLREVERRLNQLPGSPPTPELLIKLQRAFEGCRDPRGVDQRVRALKKHLVTLRDGVGRLNAYHSELTDEAVAAVQAAHAVAETELRQLIEAGELDAGLQDLERRISEQLADEKPWINIDALAPDLDRIRAAYRERRRARIARQEQLAEATREAIKQTPGFERLDADKRHMVLRPIHQALRETGEHEVRPPLTALLDGLQDRLDAAKQHAEKLLDELLADPGEVIIRVDIDVRGRVVSSARDVEALIDEIRERLLAQLDQQGKKVRLRIE